MVTYHQVRDTIERTIEHHGLDAHVLADAVAELVPAQYREVFCEYVYDKLRTSVWPPPRCACELAGLAWRSLPLEVRSVDTHVLRHFTRVV